MAKGKKTAIRPMAAGHIQLSRLDFLELEALHGVVRQELIEARQRMEEAQRVSAERVQKAEQQAVAKLNELAQKYRFDPTRPYKSCLKRSMLIQVDEQGKELGGS